MSGMEPSKIDPATIPYLQEWSRVALLGLTSDELSVLSRDILAYMKANKPRLDVRSQAALANLCMRARVLSDATR
jgi:hypothetical protein